MTAGVSIDSYSEGAVWTSITGTWDTNYPITNLGDLPRPSAVSRVVPVSGAIAIKGVLAAAAPVGIVALVHHTMAADAQMRVRLYSDDAQTAQVLDSGTIAVWPTGSAPVTNFLAVRPYIPTLTTAKSIRIDLTSISGTIDIGAIEVANFWNWAGVSNGSTIGFDVRAPAMAFAGGASQGVEQFMPRIYSGQIDYVKLADAASNGIDFQKLKGTSYPFVVVDDYEDAPAWLHGCFFARNSDVPPLVGAMYRHDTFQFRLTEHVR